MAAILTEGLFLPQITSAQGGEVTANIRRYKEYEVSTGYYEKYEMLPRHQRPLIPSPGVRRDMFPYSPTAAQIRIRTRLSDSHRGVKFYERRQCGNCHVNETMDIHTVRANLTCRQCHGGEPIAAINHYYSPFNPIRRHAYVCAKCHEGASVSYAKYIIHEPPPGAPETRENFPVFFYTSWFMLLLLAGTMAFFIPHSLMMVVQDLAIKKGKTGIDILTIFIPDRFMTALQKLFHRKTKPEK